MKNFYYLIAAVAVMLTAGFTACSELDTPVNNVKTEDVVGQWYAESAEHGTIGQGNNAVDFEKMTVYGTLNTDGRGSWYVFFFDAKGNLIITRNQYHGAGCHYTTSSDGRVHVALDGQSAATSLMPSWDMTFTDGRLYSRSGDKLIVLSRITTEQDTRVQEWLSALSHGSSEVIENYIDMSQLQSAYTAQNGDVLEGELNGNIKISIADGATVTLSNSKILLENNGTTKHAGLTCEGSATINLKGTNQVRGGDSEFPGIYVPKGSTLTIRGSGYLKVSSGDTAAAIGGGSSDSFKNKECGDIIIEGGNIFAYGGSQSAAIGSSQAGQAGNITIEGGNVNAYGGINGAAIGSGFYGKCGDIAIEDGLVWAEGGHGAEAIGGGNYGACKTIWIMGGDVYAYGGENAGCIGVGKEKGCSCDCINITGGEVYAYAGSKAPVCIGTAGDGEGKCPSIVISNQIKGLFIQNRSASGSNLRELLFADEILLGDTKQSVQFLLYYLQRIDKDIDETWNNIHYQISYAGKSLTITPIGGL